MQVLDKKLRNSIKKHGLGLRKYMTAEKTFCFEEKTDKIGLPLDGWPLVSKPVPANLTFRSAGFRSDSR